MPWKKGQRRMLMVTLCLCCARFYCVEAKNVLYVCM